MYRLIVIVQDDTDKSHGWTVVDYAVVKTAATAEELYPLCHNVALRAKQELAKELAERRTDE